MRAAVRIRYIYIIYQYQVYIYRLKPGTTATLQSFLYNIFFPLYFSSIAWCSRKLIKPKNNASFQYPKKLSHDGQSFPPSKSHVKFIHTVNTYCANIILSVKINVRVSRLRYLVHIERTGPNRLIYKLPHSQAANNGPRVKGQPMPMHQIRKSVVEHEGSAH